MTTPADIKNQLLSALAEVLDEPMHQVGFERKKASQTYSRTFSAAEQRIAFAMDSFPTCQPGAEAHIHPMLQLTMPQVNERALALVGGDKMLLAGVPDIIVNQPIEFTAPKDKHQRWFATGKEQFVVACNSIHMFLNHWVLPLLSEVSGPADLYRCA